MAFVLVSPFLEDIAKKRALDFTAFAHDPPKELKSYYGHAKAHEEELKVAAFERSRDDNRGMSVMEKLLVSSQKIQLENQRMLIQRMKREDIQDRLAALTAKAGVVKQQIELALRRAEITKDFSRVDNLEKEFDEIKKQIEEDSHFEPYDFSNCDEAN